MLFRQILNDDLGCASYLVGDAGEAAVVDPQWDVEPYLRLAVAHDVRIAHVLETHTHADHVSGRGKLVALTGAQVHVPAAAGAAFAHRPLSDGDELALGDVRLVAMATPGHRPEHLAFLVSDGSRADAPWLALTGDSLFVGDVARPDLAVQPQEGARDLFGSLGRLLALDDGVEVWPGHIGGSLCGGPGMSEKPGSTIGFERRFNPLADLAEESVFVHRLTDGLGAPPPNLTRIVALNNGPLVAAAPPPAPLSPARVRALVGDGAILVDGRPPRDHAAAHVPGALNVTMTRAGVGTRAASVVPADRELVLMGASDESARHLCRLLEAVGLMRVRGYLSGGVAAWREAGQAVARTPAIAPDELAPRLGAARLTVLDVREAHEWRAGHVEGAVHAPVRGLRDGPPPQLEGRPSPVAVICSTGTRSALAASLLRRAGWHDLLVVVDGGVDELAAAGVPLVAG